MLFFFFQAEDGIRDLIVTGVQTCALPIWPATPSTAVASTAPGGTAQVPEPRAGGAGDRTPTGFRRSGERRVGEEGRSRGAPDHLKKKKKRKGSDGECMRSK